MTAPGYRLEPCPFCEAKAERDFHYRFRHFNDGRIGKGVAIHCTNCDAYMTRCRAEFPGSSDEDLMADLEQQWNRRAAAPQNEPPLIVGKSLLRKTEQLPASECARRLDNLAKALDADRKAEAKHAAVTQYYLDEYKESAEVWESRARAEKARADKAEKALAGVSDQLGDPAEWKMKLEELHSWTGSAFLAGEPVEDEGRHKLDLYTFTCSLIGYFMAAESAAIRARKGGGDE